MESKVEISVIKVEGKPLEKLMEVISQGVGTLYKPRAIRKEADAEAYKIEVIERAKAKALANSKEIDDDFINRIAERIFHTETIKQKNIDNVNSVAAEELKNEKEVSDEKVDEDWVHRFYSHAEMVTNEEMQALWGKILAGEIKRPKSYSLRTLELIRNLSKEEADLITKAANLCIIYGVASHFLFDGEDEVDDVLVKNNLSFRERGLLIELGFIQPLKQALRLKYSDFPYAVFYYGNYVVNVILNNEVPIVPIPLFTLTSLGNEITKLLDIKPSFEYLTQFATFLKNQNIASVQYGIWENRNSPFMFSDLKDF